MASEEIIQLLNDWSHRDIKTLDDRVPIVSEQLHET